MKNTTQHTCFKMLLGYALSLIIPLCISTTIRCNRIDDGFRVEELYFDAHHNINSVKTDQMYIFNLDSGYTASYSGICSIFVKTIVGHDTGISFDTDSIYTSISSVSDTIIYVNDSLLGLPFFTLNDTSQWYILSRYIAYPDSFIFGSMLKESIDSVQFSSLVSAIQNNNALSLTQKKTVINTCTNIIRTIDFFHTHYNLLWPHVTDPSKVTQELKKLIARGIFLDTTGTVAPSLSPYHTAVVQWFNMDIFKQYVDHGIKQSPTGTPVQFFLKPTGAFRIYSVSMKRHGKNSFVPLQHITRYIGMNGYGLIQVAYSDNTAVTLCNEKKVADYTITPGKCWQITPLFFPYHPFLPETDVVTLCLLSQGIIYPNSTLSNDTTMVYDFKMYYPINGQITEDNSIVRTSGKIAQTYTFRYNPIDPLNRTAEIINWIEETIFQKTYSKDRITVYREKMDVTLH